MYKCTNCGGIGKLNSYCYCAKNEFLIKVSLALAAITSSMIIFSLQNNPMVSIYMGCSSVLFLIIYLCGIFRRANYGKKYNQIKKIPLTQYTQPLMSCPSNSEQINTQENLAKQNELMN